MTVTLRTMRCLALVAVIVLVGSCGDDAEPTGQSASVDGSATSSDFSHLAKCEDYFGEGVVVRAEAFDLAGCVTADGQPAFFNGTVQECADGRTLLWGDDVGWGFVGDPWEMDESEPPTEVLDACTG